MDGPKAGRHWSELGIGVWDAWVAMRKRQSKLAWGVVLDPETLTPLTSEEFSADLISIFEPMGIAVNAELLTTYSWRRMLQTFTDSAGFSWHERTVMGWRAAKDAGERISWMPARYAADFDVTKQILNYTACRAFAMAVNAASAPVTWAGVRKAALGISVEEIRQQAIARMDEVSGVRPPLVCQRQELVEPRHFELVESKCLAWRERLEKVNRTSKKRSRAKKESADAARRPAELALGRG